MKEWRKLQWGGNHPFIFLRRSELLVLGLNKKKKYAYRTKIEGKKIIIEFKEAKK